ncbi:kinase-like domain-containing protein [Alternaria rosae]|uniref:kinase-like domain-containing protein n=1 Tax=Alternaria rosae TaxID=1187941 RepID=UPI001E8C9DE7|nr:kinase-like domain-containing protein [Alternaria rosae]KAH6868138.1 kinase-like domain-containing protein [Alternaria rosae]
MSRRMPIQHHPSQFSSSGTSSPLEQPPCEYIDGVMLDWSGRGTSHVDFDKSEVLPLTQGEFLGHGMHGGVYETSCNGVKLAWKRKYCRRKIGEREMREIEIIKKLSHRHIIRMMGTYTHGPFLGLLLWPVATCDLATLLEDVDWLQKKVLVENGDAPGLSEKQSEHDVDREARFRALGVLIRDPEIDSHPARHFLKQSIGCIASAVAYLHASNVKHKDLKPSNILLSRDGLWLADFGTATDFSVLTSSVTDEGDRGTQKYFAPEVARFAPSGRSADIFSLGCILFEVVTLYIGYTLTFSQRLRRSHDKSFQSNLDQIVGWFEEAIPIASTAADDYLLGLVRWMMEEEAAMRPTADVVEEEVFLISGLGLALCTQHARQIDWGFHRPCCLPEERPDRRIGLLPTPKPVITIKVTYGTGYLMSSHSLECTVYLEHTGGGLVESVHMFTS